jgi:hypothetical protein
MIKLIQSKRVQLPIVYLVETAKDLQNVPLGIPFIRGRMSDYNNCVQMMEFEVLWKSMIETDLPFSWKQILADNGYVNTWNYGIAKSSGMHDAEISDEDWMELGFLENKGGSAINASNFLNEISYKVDIDVIKDLKLIPCWLMDIEAAVNENILNSVTYNPMLYNKKLDLPLGGLEFNSPKKNVIIIDISGSIPNGVSMTMLTLAKTMADQFYADVLITGGKSVIYDYDKVDGLVPDDLYSEIGQNNDQAYFKKLLSEKRVYKTAIVFGDNDCPGHKWSRSDKAITDVDGKKLCKWEIDNILSFHTHDNSKLAGYARWFDTYNVTHIDNWVKDLNKKK